MRCRKWSYRNAEQAWLTSATYYACPQLEEEFEDTKGGNQNSYIEEEQTAQWAKEKVQMDKQRSTKHTHKTNDRETRILLKTGVNSGAQEG